ncbi:MAG: hypothetical protein Q8Q60_02225 [Candidatus Chromulinivorax sp.]|nr:hypothetical protein [Candidatus Chromulinivorax sp.]
MKINISSIACLLLLAINSKNFTMNSSIPKPAVAAFIFNREQQLLLENTPDGWRPPTTFVDNLSLQQTAGNYIQNHTSIIPHNFTSIGSFNKTLCSDNRTLHTFYCLQTNSFGRTSSDLSTSINFDWFHHTNLPCDLDTNIFKPEQLLTIMKNYAKIQSDNDHKTFI